ncbi:PapB/FocB family fimbrial expression transcriptional regulator [Edwardsiella tarda]
MKKNTINISPGNILCQGEVNIELFEQLIEISSIRSENVILSLKDFFVIGKKRKLICEERKIHASYLSIKIRELQDLSGKILSIYPHYNAYFHERISPNNIHRDRVITFEQIAE